MRAFKYRLYPRPSQETALTAMLGDFCSLYNAALESRIDARHKGVNLTYGAQAAEPAAIVNPLGIDMGLDAFIACSDGTTVKAPRFFREGQQRLRVLQRSVARKLAARRADFLHRQTNVVLSKTRYIAVEDLNIKGLARTRLAKSVHDAAKNILSRSGLDRRTQSTGDTARLAREAVCFS